MDKICWTSDLDCEHQGFQLRQLPCVGVFGFVLSVLLFSSALD